MVTIAEIVLVACLSSATGTSRFLTEPRVHPDAGVLVCRITSDASAGRSVRVEALDGAGAPTFDSGPFTLSAGATFLSSGGVEARRCRFSVEGEVRGVRAHGLLMSSEGQATSLPPKRVR